MGTLGDNELVTDPKYYVKWLVDEKMAEGQSALPEAERQQSKQ